MNKSRSIFSAIKDTFVKISPYMVVCSLLFAVFCLFFGLNDGSGEFFYAGLFVICVIAASFAVSGIVFILTGSGRREEIVSDYDRKIIGNCFRMGAKAEVYSSALRLLKDGEFSEALEGFSQLKDKNLNSAEIGVLNFYLSICYGHMGYSTNAAHCAAKAAAAEIGLPDSHIMAARNFVNSGSYSEAEGHYEKLIDIADNSMDYPYIYIEAGRMYIMAQKPDKAKECFEKSTAIGFNTADAHGGMALVSLLENKADEACEWYRLALLCRVSDAEGYKKYCGQVCTCLGYPENYLETRLIEKYKRARCAEMPE